MRDEAKTAISSRVAKAVNSLVIFGFALGLALPFLGLFQGDVSATIEEHEGRSAAAFPEIKMKTSSLIPRPKSESIKAFPRRFEKWLNDRIGFRRQLIQVFQVANYYGWTPKQLSNASILTGEAATGVMGHLNDNVAPASGQDRVLIGRDGWLFYQTDAVINEYRGTNLFSEAELARWNTVLTQRRDWLAQRGIRYLVVVTPNKSTIYPEYMPRSVNRVSEESRLTQFTEYLARESSVPCVSLLEPMLAAKLQRRLFHKTDTHWNDCGAMIAGQEILKHLKRWFPDVHVPSFEDYDIQTHDCDTQNVGTVVPWGGMDLAIMQGSPIPYREDVIRLVPRREELVVPVQLARLPRSKDEQIVSHTLGRGSISSAYVIHDSYMLALAQFLAPNFQEVTYQWKDGFPMEDIERKRPVVVIQQFVQRRLMTYEPTNPPSMEDELR